MTTDVVRPSEPGHLPALVAMLAHARRERRRRCPLLPAGLDDARTAEAVLQGARGAVALSRDGQPCGFLLPERREDPFWGDSVVVEVDRWGLAAGAGAGTLAGLYAAGVAPLTRGISEHVVYCPSHERRLLDAWFHLGFGMEQAFAAARLEDLRAGHTGRGDLVIRRAGPGDEDILISLSHLVLTMQAGPPVWAGLTTEYLGELRQGFAELASDRETVTLLAFSAGRAVGYQVWSPMEGALAEHASDAGPYGAGSVGVDGVAGAAVELAAAATLPEERGTGVGSALTAEAAAEARRAGYTACFTDWRTTNPLSSAFWPARGFTPYLYRLVRRLAPQGDAGGREGG